MVFKPIGSFNDKAIQKFKALSEFFSVSRASALDDLSAIRVATESEEKSLETFF